MFDKNHLTGNGHLSAEAADAFEVRMVREKPELAESFLSCSKLLIKSILISRVNLIAILVEEFFY